MIDAESAAWCQQEVGMVPKQIRRKKFYLRVAAAFSQAFLSCKMFSAFLATASMTDE